MNTVDGTTALSVRATSIGLSGVEVEAEDVISEVIPVQPVVPVEEVGVVGAGVDVPVPVPEVIPPDVLPPEVEPPDVEPPLEPPEDPPDDPPPPIEGLPLPPLLDEAFTVSLMEAVTPSAPGVVLTVMVVS